MSYETFSYYYDSLMDPTFYEDYYHFINEHAIFDEVLELGCGTGEIALRLAKDNKQVFASDLSTDMLEVAKQKAMAQNVNMMFQRVDMTDFKTSHQVDLILCLCDSINYVLDENKVKQTFANVYESLKDKGTFIFDIDSLYKTDVILNDYHENEEDEEFAFRWDVELLDKGYVHHRVYIEDKIEKEVVKEDHYQKTYEVSQYLDWLKETGFEYVEYYGEFKEYDEMSERIIFVCRKG